MKNFFDRAVVGVGIFALSPVARATHIVEWQELIGKGGLYVLFFVAIVVGVYVYFMRLRDKHAAPLHRIYDEGSKSVHSVTPDTLVMECVQTMVSEKIGALIVVDGERVTGIFTERDALNRVLAAGLDPRSTRVSQVMTKDPVCAPPTMSVRTAMELITQQRFRHLPIVREGKIVSVISSGDLTHWLVKDQLGEVKELVELAARS